MIEVLNIFNRLIAIEDAALVVGVGLIIVSTVLIFELYRGSQSRRRIKALEDAAKLEAECTAERTRKLESELDGLQRLQAEQSRIIAGLAKDIDRVEGRVEKAGEAVLTLAKRVK